MIHRDFGDREGAYDESTGFHVTAVISSGVRRECEVAKMLQLAVERSESSHPAGESKEGAALFGWDLGYPPTPYPLRFPPGKWADVRGGDGRTSTRSQSAPTNTEPELKIWLKGAPHLLSQARS